MASELGSWNSCGMPTSWCSTTSTRRPTRATASLASRHCTHRSSHPAIQFKVRTTERFLLRSLAGPDFNGEHDILISSLINLHKSTPGCPERVAAPPIHYSIFSTECFSVQSQNKRSPHVWIWLLANLALHSPSFRANLNVLPRHPKTRWQPDLARTSTSSTGQSLTAGTQGWAATLGRGLANRYLTGALCTGTLQAARYPTYCQLPSSQFKLHK